MRNVPKKYNKLSISEAFETAKLSLTTLAEDLKRYTRQAETRRKNEVFSIESSRELSVTE